GGCGGHIAPPPDDAEPTGKVAGRQTVLEGLKLRAVPERFSHGVHLQRMSKAPLTPYMVIRTTDAGLSRKKRPTRLFPGMQPRAPSGRRRARWRKLLANAKHFVLQ